VSDTVARPGSVDPRLATMAILGAIATRARRISVLEACFEHD